MKNKLIGLFLFCGFIQVFAQDYHIYKSKLKKGDFAINRIELIVDSVSDPKIDKFSFDFAKGLEKELSNYKVDCYLVKRNSPNCLEISHQIDQEYYPNGIMFLYPLKYVNIQFKTFNGIKKSLVFHFELEFRKPNVENYTNLILTKIGVALDSMEISGEVVSKEVVKNLIKAGYINNNNVDVKKKIIIDEVYSN